MTTQCEALDKLMAYIREQGYSEVRLLPDGSIAALGDLLFTRAIHLGCDLHGFARRYCFEDKALADQRFAELQSEDDIPAGHIASR